MLENFRPFPPVQCCLKYFGRSIQFSSPTLNGARGKFPRQNVQRCSLRFMSALIIFLSNCCPLLLSSKIKVQYVFFDPLVRSGHHSRSLIMDIYSLCSTVLTNIPTCQVMEQSTNSPEMYVVLKAFSLSPCNAAASYLLLSV